MNSSKHLNAWLGGFGFTLLAVGCSDCGGPTEPVNAEIQFVADRTLLENTFNSTFRFEVRLDATYEEEVTVEFETLEGTAKAGEDYLSQAGTLVFAPGELVQQIEVPIIIDEGLEPDEQFTIELSNPVNGYLKGNQQVATGTILNDDTELDITLPEGGYDTPHSPDNPPSGMTLVWSDEFEGAQIDMNNWTHELGAGGWGNNESQRTRLMRPIPSWMMATCSSSRFKTAQATHRPEWFPETSKSSPLAELTSVRCCLTAKDSGLRFGCWDPTTPK